MNQSIIELFEEAIRRHVSDIYLLPRQKDYVISFYQATKFKLYKKVTTDQARQIINFLKFKSDMSISERRRPQLGSWSYSYQNTKIFCRFSSVGTFLDQESLVIRLIYHNISASDGYFFQKQFQQISAACKKRGLVLFSGPMGSGKTTSMYTFAQQLTDKLVMTIEDPVEIYEPRFLQLQVNDKADMSYEKLLVAALRLHPDVFLIGEIRNEQTAAIAIKAALSGHLVLSTVHAQNVYGVFLRLLNLGVSQYDLEQTVQLVSYQRLIETTSQGPKVLFDILPLDGLSWNEIRQKKRGEMTDEWNKKLVQCVKERKITVQTQEKYSCG
ncbi:competence type IV pilus ATPase ComGA [Ligilactobacillus pobuzihii]|uniref:ComG operon protein 1 n=1 Tax=Ligilactobacillus pobuzihii TaxID=449659 RepID=A0A0R2LDM7_9LACO|nr:competence type IV pilus ATPase ComGA [Ligilactobacillus pobuzihii]KRK10591.1 ComG operon protein 1 [Ligilactobacillus pobuzihii E100301 = KCTC 13174]KRN97372.1 ComG operon protein 1 [Ligilactobacillus pobuzihii]GEN48036.1 competence protein ComG [Ligilactobacillus pobuzihii]